MTQLLPIKIAQKGDNCFVFFSEVIRSEVRS